jgi:high-affinity iron transporter
MLGAAIIVFREVLEAAMIVGIVAAAARGRPGRARWLAGGIAGGVAASILVASLTGRLADLADGAGQELLNAAILSLAVAMLAWHLIWMSRHARDLSRDAKKLGEDVADGRRDLSALAVVVGLAVTREGSETALFLYGLIAGGGTSISTVLGGGALGLALGVLAGAGLYAGFVRIPARWFFSATSGLILLLAAAMASQCARVLIQADLLPSLATPFWDLSRSLSNDSSLGTLLHALIGYDAAPAGMQVLFYVAALVLIASGMQLSRAPRTSS